ncbi:hypothetical protein cyc_00162 [Cyclospora cayetanensis]|uniref:Uncharacterized protein n=1 Tax=Cyclospora cayetanensis TaxID=88456 RepID=A0A1D3CXL5_9EIME|nr:hypothetical protein cyc_00162 [Cyclospora cayetanensis]
MNAIKSRLKRSLWRIPASASPPFPAQPSLKREEAMSFGVGVSACREFSSWSGLGAFVEGSSQGPWQALRQNEQRVSSIVKKIEADSRRVQQIDWDNMRAHYESQSSLFSALLSGGASSSLTRVHGLAVGWDSFSKALESCEASVRQSESLLNSGAAALWVSYHNPPVSKLDTNEWLDTDLYWQAFVEKHHFYSPYQPPLEDPESPAEKERVKASWHSRMAKFNDRSDTPMLYNFMETLPSWEYYDIHRRAFLEHMIYFLVRRGADYRFFPEITPWQWLGDIEDQRAKFFSVFASTCLWQSVNLLHARDDGLSVLSTQAQRRRSHFQLSSLSREKPLDLLPLDVEHDGAVATLRFLQAEATAVSATVGRLMASFSFLPDPFIPCSSTRSALRAMEVDGGKGQWFDLGEDVSALFYLPTKQARRIPHPREAFYKVMDHLTMTGKRMNPAYATLFDSFTDVLQQRGDNWFCDEGECASQAFLRRLRSDDPMREVFCDYFEEMYSRFEAAKEVKPAEFLKLLAKKEASHGVESEVYRHWALFASPEAAATAKEESDHLTSLFKSKQLQPVLDANGIVAIGPDGQKITDAGQVVASFNEFELLKETIQDSIKALKVPGGTDAQKTN